MNRTPVKYTWKLSTGTPLSGERHSHRMKGKSKGGKSGGSSIPRGLPRSSSQFSKDVHYGSHASIAKQIGEALLRAGL